MDLSDGRSLLDESVGEVIILWCLFSLPHSPEGGLELRKLRLSGHPGFELLGEVCTLFKRSAGAHGGPRGCARGRLR